jgi:hypothetical protein
VTDAERRALVGRVLAATDVLAAQARVRLGAAGGERGELGRILSELTEDERVLMEGAFVEGARLATALLLERAVVQVPDFIAAFE